MVDKKDPRYSEYMAECHKMAEEIDRKKAAVIAGDPEYRGRDRLEISLLDREFGRRLKEIQKKYGFT